MHEYRVTERARRDLVSISYYILQNDPAAADKTVQSIETRFPALAQFPEMGIRCDHLTLGLRRLSVGQYNIYYQILTDYVEIVRVLHGARDIEAIFDEPESE